MWLKDLQKDLSAGLQEFGQELQQQVKLDQMKKLLEEKEASSRCERTHTGLDC